MRRVINFFQTRLPLGKKITSKKNYLLALDIGTEFVKALIFKIEPVRGEISNGKEESEERNQGLILGLGRQRQFPGQMQASVITDIEGVALTCQKAIEKAARMARLMPRRVVIGVAGEFVKGATTNFVYQRAKPEEEITLAELKNIVQKIQWKAFDQIRSKLAWETGRPEIEIRLINALITDIRIDGYQVTNPLGFQGREIFLSIFNVYTPLVQLRALESIVSRLNLELLSIVAEPYALSKTLSLDSGGGAIFIDVGGQTTDIALVRRGAVEGIKSFTLAGRAFTKRLSQALNLDLAEAEEIKLRHAFRQLSPNAQRKIRDILEGNIKIWLSGVELILEEFVQSFYRDYPGSALKKSQSGSEFPSVESFPPLILLCGGGSLLPGIRSALKRETVQAQWLKKFPFNQPFQVRFIKPNHINNIIDQTKMLTGPENIIPMALAGLSLEIVADEKKVLPPILRRVVRMMR